MEYFSLFQTPPPLALWHEVSTVSECDMWSLIRVRGINKLRYQTIFAFFRHVFLTKKNWILWVTGSVLCS